MTARSETPRVHRLRCDDLTRPDGLHSAAPIISWAVSGDSPRITAWRIIADFSAASIAQGHGALWDSGKVGANGVFSAIWGGPALPRDARVFYSVQVWDHLDQASDFAPVASFFTGLAPQDWHGDWIARYFVLPEGRAVPQDTTYDNRFQARPADYLRRPFALQARPARAFVYASALGLYELYLNGHRIGDHVMAPGWTDYHIRAPYQSFDVTDLLTDGPNVIGAILGEGWYSGRIGHNQRRAGNHYGGRPALMLQLHIDMENGETLCITSDDQWQTRQGPVCYSDFLAGEMYDARLDLTGWCDAAYQPENWQPVEAITPEPRAPLLEPSRTEPARKVASLPVRQRSTAPDGSAVFDFGQNLAGYVRMQVTAPRGTEIRLRHAERLDGNGALYTDNLRYAVSEDIYICHGNGPEEYTPRFTFHGFQYVGLTSSAPLQDVSLQAVAIQTDLPVTGQISTGNPMLNQLISNIFWSQRGNFLSVPTDCPQRDERYGWTADAQVFWRTAGYFMDVTSFLSKWMEDLIDGQSADGVFPDVAPTKPLNPYRLTPQPGAPAWGDAPIIMAWDHYTRYGDAALLQRCWQPFVAWMDWIERQNPDGLRVNGVNNNYGDWLSIGPATHRPLINTAYWIRLVDLMGRIAETIGQTPTRWSTLAARLRDTFLAAFWHEDRLTGDTQTAYLLALDFELLPPPLRAQAAARLDALIAAADGHLQTGFLGVRHLAPVVCDWLSPARAVDLLLKDTYPSWGFSIAQGATTIWERWDGWTPDGGFQSTAMNSFNHYAYGAVGEWIWARLAGIDTDPAGPGFRKLRMRPVFDGRIGHVSAWYDAPHGRIHSAWTMDGNRVNWQVTLPADTCAHVTLPAGWTAPQGADFILTAGAHDLRLTRPETGA
ncbi:alpha-L-rhamnosidase [Roseinatronobacter alkalisoli]|uniref:alpha-L-rhamnosidase n=1 Tax=Roseinatronobacter alkalisoli TaxID=3028235 RepID=A0ABT5T793_9RHOB|nr:alpha-L-rhamnosidase [Roseinatronobacter sp. HJB301]MDD7970261.1 family 78 glycoside hydrolase catalytic domain [Roseinatronobacter sp. HJB301]